MGIDVIRTGASQRGPNVDGIIDVSNVETAAIPAIAAEQNVHIERRGKRTYLVPSEA